MAYKPSAFKIIGWVIKAILYMLIIFVVSLLIWRVYFSTKIPAEIKQLVITDSLTEAYDPVTNTLYGYSQSQSTITRDEKCYGYFSIEEYVIIPEAHQVQIIFRYNNSTIDHLVEDYSLASTPDRTEELYEVTLLKQSGSGEDLTETRYTASQIIPAQTKLYNYRRIVFENVDITDDDVSMFADIYYVGDIDYNEQPYGALCLYDNESERDSFKFPASDLKKLAEAAK